MERGTTTYLRLGFCFWALSFVPAWAASPANLAPDADAPALRRPRVTFVAVALDEAAQSSLPSLWLVGEQGVVRSPRFEPVPVTDALDPAGARTRGQHLAEAQQAFDAGLKLYTDLDSQAALAQFDKAIRAVEQTDLTLHFDLLSRALVMRVAAQVANGQSFLVDNEMDRVLALNPRAQFSPNFFPPEWMAKAERQRRTALEGGHGKLDVQSRPPAQLFLNGQFRGETPKVVNGLMRPEQYVTLKAPGYALEQRRVFEAQVAWPLRRAPGAAALTSLEAAVRGDARGPGRDLGLRSYAETAGADQVILMAARAGARPQTLEVLALRLDARDGHTYAFREEELPMGEPLLAQADSELTHLLTEDAPRDSGKPVTRYPGSGWTRKRTGYLLLGGGLAALVGGTVMIVHGAQVHHHVQEGVGIGLDVVGLAAVGLGTYWGFFAPAPGEAVAPASSPVAPEPIPRSRASSAPPPSEPPTPAPAPAPAPAPVKPAPAPVKPASTPSRSATRTKERPVLEEVDPSELQRRKDLRDQLEQEAAEKRRQTEQQKTLEDAEQRRKDQRRKEKTEDLRNF